MAWALLFLAGLCEMVWPLGFKYTAGFKVHYWAVAGTFAVMITSFWLMSQATGRGIPIGTAYAVWTGLGATGTVLLGMALFHESRDVFRLACLTLIVLGVVGLKLREGPSAATGAAGHPPAERVQPRP